jgi:hypothetical protein
MKKSVIIQIKRIIGKLSEISGETIVETLVSMLIVVLAFMMLAGAIVAAARVNSATENRTMFVNQADATAITGATVEITTSTGTITRKTVKKYKMKDSSGTLYYYE